MVPHSVEGGASDCVNKSISHYIYSSKYNDKVASCQTYHGLLHMPKGTLCQFVDTTDLVAGYLSNGNVLIVAQKHNIRLGDDGLGGIFRV